LKEEKREEKREGKREGKRKERRGEVGLLNQIASKKQKALRLPLPLGIPIYPCPALPFLPLSFP
jgi:hypothetical protein